jgi:hypothetical protein
MANVKWIRNNNGFEKNPNEKLSEFEELLKMLAEKELDLATLEGELFLFENKYARTIGVLLAEQDRLEREIAEVLLKLHPDEEYKKGFQRAEKKARESQEAVDENVGLEKRSRFIPSEEVRALYRKICKMVHPDLSTDKEERDYRTALMARANEAYRKGDKAALEQILYEWEHREEKASLAGSDTKQASEIEQKILQIKKRIHEIDQRIDELENSDLCKLLRKVDRAEKEGRDLLGEMARDIKIKIDAAKGLLTGLQEQLSG